MGSRKYYQHVERDPENIKSIWKVLHTITFLLLIFNSLASTYIFSNILKIFNYRCMLHLDIYFDIIEFGYMNETHEEVAFFESVMKNLTEYNDTNPLAENTELKGNNNVSKQEEHVVDLTNTDAQLLKISFFNNRERKVDLSHVKDIPETLKHSYFFNNTIWYKNDSLYGKIDIRARGSQYGTPTSCDLVLFVPLISLIASAAFGALVVLFGRGQVSERSWFMVYPLLVTSAILLIFSIIVTVSMKNGLEDFCSKLKDFTGFISCSRSMNYFSFQRRPLHSFWEEYLACYYSFILSILLWTIQLLITVSRLSTMADFKFVTLTVETTEINANEEYQKIERALMNSGIKPAKDLFPSEDDLSVIEPDELSTKV